MKIPTNPLAPLGERDRVRGHLGGASANLSTLTPALSRQRERGIIFPRNRLKTQQLGILTDNVTAALAEPPPAAPDKSHQKTQRVPLFTGHRIDVPECSTPRFPPEKESEARAADPEKMLLPSIVLTIDSTSDEVFLRSILDAAWQASPASRQRSAGSLRILRIERQSPGTVRRLFALLDATVERNLHPETAALGKSK